MSMASVSVMAGGYMTNTNLSATFQRNPAREGAIAIDGIYSNPAGTVFLEHGLHIQVNWQAAFQHRYIDTEYDPFQYNINNPSTVRNVKGQANAPVVPSILGCYNHDRWNIQVMAGLVGGGGKCIFDNGLSSFEQSASTLYTMGKSLGITGYGLDSYMRGKQYYLGYQVGAGYKANENLSLYAGVRVTQAICEYYGYIHNIQIEMGGQTMPAYKTFENIYLTGVQSIQQALGGASIEQAEAYIDANAENNATCAKLHNVKNAMSMTEDITLNCDQKGWGVAPVIGMDYRLNDQWNFSVKYEFRTKMSLKNRSANEGGENIDLLKQYADGAECRDDIAAIVAAGVQYSPVPQCRITASYHEYMDKDAKKVGNKQDLLDKNSWEVLLGVEYDIKNLTLSCGAQSTNYGNTDAYMSDVSFITNSYSIGFGAAYKFSKHWTLDAGCLKTFYSDYTVKTAEKKDTYSRNNIDFALGLTMNF